MRRFSQALGVSHTVLSLVLSGKRPLSKKAAIKVSDFLGFDPTQRDSLLANRKSIGPCPAGQTDYQQISLDVFSVVSDWYHFAILSLLILPGAKFEPRWISSKLGISEIESKLAIERLVRLGLVEKNSKGQWKQAGKSIKIDNPHSTAATRKFHTQLLAKALESLEHDPFDRRDFTAMTLAIDPAQLPYARERIRAFRRDLTDELESRAKPKQVYNLNIQLFPISKSTHSKSEES